MISKEFVNKWIWWFPPTWIVLGLILGVIFVVAALSTIKFNLKQEYKSWKNQ